MKLLRIVCVVAAASSCAHKVYVPVWEAPIESGKTSWQAHYAYDERWKDADERYPPGTPPCKENDLAGCLEECKHDRGSSCAEVARIYSRGPKPMLRVEGRARTYATGTGVPADPAKAQLFWNATCFVGHGDADCCDHFASTDASAWDVQTKNWETMSRADQAAFATRLVSACQSACDLQRDAAGPRYFLRGLAEDNPRVVQRKRLDEMVEHHLDFDYGRACNLVGNSMMKNGVANVVGTTSQMYFEWACREHGNKSACATIAEAKSAYRRDHPAAPTPPPTYTRERAPSVESTETYQEFQARMKQLYGWQNHEVPPRPDPPVRNAPPGTGANCETHVAYVNGRSETVSVCR